MYDVIIIGQGPAGITAGIYTARREMKTLIIGKEPGGQIALAGKIENYPGFLSVDSFDLINLFNEQVLNAGAELKNEEVREIKKQDDGNFLVFTEKNQYQAKTVIATIGLLPRRLAVPGEVELSGKGVSYCANCDGPLFKGQDVAVIGGGNSAFEAAEVLSKIAKNVYLVVRTKNFKAFDSLIKIVKERENIEIITDAETSLLKGDAKLESLVYKQDGEEKELKVDGVFIEIGRIAHTDLLADLVERDENLQIIVDKNFSTKTPGLFAAGDVVQSDFKQITIAMGQATAAALYAYQFLQGPDAPKIVMVK